MLNNDVVIRTAEIDDAAGMLDIYAYYVTKTAISFEYDVPSVSGFRERMRRVQERFPWCVALDCDEIVGYAYASAFKERAAYAWNAETTVYVRAERRRGGIGRRLYAELESSLRKQGILSMKACIAVPEKDDEYLTRNSVNFHAHMGFRFVGEFQQCGYKFGRWYHMAWMEKHIGEHRNELTPPIPYPDTLKDCRRKV